MGHLKKDLNALLATREKAIQAYASMVPGRKKSEATVQLARLDRQIKGLRARIAGHGHRRKKD